MCVEGLPKNTMKIEPPWILTIPQYFKLGFYVHVFLLIPY